MNDGGAADGGAVGLLLSRDLFFNSKITGTAQAMGRRVVVAGTEAKALERLAERRPAVVFVDLGGGELVGPGALARYRESAPGVPFVAFGSHVDAGSLAAAREAGCAEVMPRSRFTAVLPDLIGRYLGGAGPTTTNSEGASTTGSGSGPA